ncbi:MAG: hypothetical protein ACRDGU_04575 [Actinomycetota bacterium]
MALEGSRPHLPGLAAACLVAGLGLLAVSCGRLAGVGAEPATVRVGPGDAGRTFVLEAGARLVLALSAGPAAPSLEWKLLTYPTGILELVSSDEEKRRFEFVAREPGEGEVRLSGRPRCEGPLPAAMTDHCPLGAPGEQGARPSGAIPVRLFSITVRVG